MAPKERNIAMMGYRSVGECKFIFFCSNFLILIWVVNMSGKITRKFSCLSYVSLGNTLISNQIMNRLLLGNFLHEISSTPIYWQSDVNSKRSLAICLLFLFIFFLLNILVGCNCLCYRTFPFNLRFGASI